MVDVFTPLLRLNQQEVGAKLDAWAPDLNAGVTQLIDDSIAGRVDISVTAGNVVLTIVNGATDQARFSTLRVIGTPGVARQIQVPSTDKFYVVFNASDSDVTIKTLAGTGTIVRVGQLLIVMVDSVLDEVFPISLTGSAIAVAANWQTGTFENLSRTAGDQFVTYRYTTQGAHSMILFPATSFTCSVNGWALDADTPSDWPSEILPTMTSISFPCWVVDNGVQQPGYVLVNANPLVTWSVLKADGVAFTAATVRSIQHNMHFIFNKRLIF